MDSVLQLALIDVYCKDSKRKFKRKSIMKQLKKRPQKNLELINGYSYPYLCNRRVALLKTADDEIIVKYEWESNDGPETEYYEINRDEFQVLNSIEYDGADDAGYASELLEAFCQMLRDHEENEYFRNKWHY